jgi:hypothetical protein
MDRFLRTAALLFAASTLAGVQTRPAERYLAVGLFIGSIEEGARIFTPVRLLPFDHSEALGHQFPTVLQLHRGESALLLRLGEHAGLGLAATLQRYPTEPDTAWPYSPFLPPPADLFDAVSATVKPFTSSPLPGLRAIAFVDRVPIGFIVDTRGMSLAERHMRQATTMGLDITRAELLDALSAASQTVSPTGPAILIYRR